MHLTVKESRTLGVLTLQGALTQNHSEELKFYLRRALDCKVARRRGVARGLPGFSYTIP